MSENDIREAFKDVINKWRIAESQRTIFGMEALQAQRAVQPFVEILEEIFKSYPTFYLARKEQKMELIVKDEKDEQDPNAVVTVPVNLPSLPKAFTEMKIDSITMTKGITEDEIKSFFRGLSTRPDVIEQEGGFKEFLKKEGVKHIIANQMKFKLLRDDEHVSGMGGPGGGMGTGAGGEGKGGGAPGGGGKGTGGGTGDGVGPGGGSKGGGGKGTGGGTGDDVGPGGGSKGGGGKGTGGGTGDDVGPGGGSKGGGGKGTGGGTGDGKGPGGGAEGGGGKGTGGGTGDGEGPGGGGKGKVKTFGSAWKDYIDGKVEAKDFKGQYGNYVGEAYEDTKELEKTLKRIVGKQKQVEKFLANLEQKLFELGFPQDAIDTLKKKLLKPKKVMVAEDELARLRKIEADYNKDAGGRVDDSLETIKKIRKKLDDEKERADAILHQTGEGGLVLDKDENIVAVNPTAQNILGITADEIQGKKLKDALKAHHILTTVEDWQKESEEHTPKKVKISALDEETLAVIRESAIVLQDENGRAIGVVSSLHNVTQQDDLKKRKNDILDVLGHDLRAPLCAIKQNFDVFVDSADAEKNFDPQQVRFLDNCRNNIKRMEKMITKILDVRQFQTGKIMLKYDTIETNKLLEDAATSIDKMAKDKNIQVDIKTEKLPNIDVDPERIYQVITNLVTNAIKFTPNDGKISVSGKLVDAGKTLEVSVTDSGIGISKENCGKIFTKYEQVSLETPSGISGLGLGLSICQSIIDLHKGKIWVDSDVDQGSTFTFQIPIRNAEEASDD